MAAEKRNTTSVPIFANDPSLEAVKELVVLLTQLRVAAERGIMPLTDEARDLIERCRKPKRRKIAATQ